MKKILKNTAYFIAVALMALSCTEAEIPVYQVSDSAVYFSKKSTEFSLKGNTEAEPELVIPINLHGPACDYDRQISVAVADSTFNDAVLGKDFNIVSAVVPANELSGSIVLKVKALDNEVTSHTVALVLEADESFPRTVKGGNYTKVHWSKEFVRPDNEYAWQSWFYFFSTGYSVAYHELLYNFFGPDIEISGYTNGAMRDPNSVYHVISWWYAASRDFYNFVKEHDAANPDTPYMHSKDYEVYQNYKQAVGDGTKPEVIPTVLSTLLVY